MKIKKLSTLIIACYASFLMVLPGTAQISNLFNKREKFTYRGTVRDSLADFPISQTMVSIKNTRVSTVTDEQGKFSILTNLGPEIILLFNKSGYLEKPYLVDSANTVKVFLLVENGLEQPDLFTPAKKQDHHLTSPVTVEKIEYNDLQSSPSFTFFQSLGHLKGVDLATSGLQMQSINYQGLGGATNPRFMYLIDGMDNQIPGEGFTMGNITGISELEIQTAELVAGPSSILYGANAYNGLLSVKSKSPFDYKGLSGLVKYGVNHIEGVDGTEAAPIYEFGLRYATAFKDLVALKLGYSRFSGTDWQGSDISNARPGSEGQGTRDTEPGYDGVNVYGDESSSVFPFGLSGSDQLVTRTGYNEKDLVEYDVDSEKFDFALHTKITNGVEAIIQLQHGEGNTLFYGNNRSVIQDLEMDKFKFEVKGNHFFLRSYTVTHTFGRNYDALLLGRELNLSVKGNTSWFKDYGSLFNSPPFDQNTHNQARLFADGFGLNESGFSLPRTQPDDPNFEIIKNNIIDQNGPGFSPPILVQLENDTKLTHNEVFYDFKHLLGFVGIQIGVMNRKYELNQLTTLLNNVLNLDDYNEGAVYGQVYKDLFYDKLKISVSFRQHDNGIFGSDFFPGANAVYSLPGNHHFRLSYRTGFRNPTLQEMFISKDIGPGSLQGGLLDLTTVTIPQQGNPNGLPITITGNTIFLKNVNNFGIAVDREVGQGIAPDSAVNNNTDILLDGIVLLGDLRPLEIEKN